MSFDWPGRPSSTISRFGTTRLSEPLCLLLSEDIHQQAGQGSKDDGKKQGRAAREAG